MIACEGSSALNSKSRVVSFSTGANHECDLYTLCTWMCYEKQCTSRDADRMILVHEHQGQDYKQSQFNESS